MLSDGTRTFTWEHGRELSTVTKNGITWTNTYDANGMRTARTGGGTTYQYVYSGSSLLQMRRGSDIFLFRYGADGQPVGFTLKGTPYYYVTNIQGDVVAILNSSGTAVVTYTYDAWGKILSTTGSMASTLGTNNPLRYRGYVYDQETGLYYVCSRYYNPEICRWINADGVISGIGGDIRGYNLFAYCMNNPVNMSDQTGHWPQWLEKVVKVASIVVAVAAVVTTVVAVSAFTAGTGSAFAVYASGVFLGAALSGINGGVANEAKGNSYANGYVGGATGGTIQGICSKYPGGAWYGGGIGVGVGTAVTDGLNNLDPDSSNSSAQEIFTNVTSSTAKALVTSSITQFMGTAIGGVNPSSGVLEGAVANQANGLMPSLTLGFGESLKAFFSWIDDAVVYIWE